MTTFFPNLPIPVTQETLPCGLTVMTGLWRGYPLANVKLVFPFGSVDDGRHPGIMHFLEHLLFKEGKEEATRLTKQHLRSATADNGKTNAFNVEYEIYDGPAEHVVDMIRTLTHIVLFPHLSEESMETERPIVLQEIAENRTEDLIEIQAYKVLYPRVPSLHHTTTGRAQTVKKIRIDDLTDHHRRHFDLSQALLVVVGDVAHEQIVSATDRLSKEFGVTYRPRAPREIVEPGITGTNTIINKHEPTGVFMYFPKPRMVWENVVINFAGELLHGAPFGILWQTLRKQHGVSYEIKVHNNSWPESFVEISTACGPEHFDLAEQEIYAGIQSLIDQRYDTATLFAYTKQRWENWTKKRFARPLEADIEQENLIEQWLVGKTESTDPRDILNRLTPDLVSEIAQKYLTKPYGSIRVVNE